jgi:hypothetical protein
MRALSDFFPWIMPFAPNCPDPIAEQYLRVAADEFCTRTRSWREIETIDVRGDEQEIICVPPQATLMEIEDAWWDKQWRLRRVPYADIRPDLLPAYDPANPPPSANVPEVISQAGPNGVVVAPRSRGCLRVNMFLKPAPDADELPDYLFDQFAQPLSSGALSWILMLPGQPFTNPQQAQLFASDFNAICDRHFGYNIRGQQRAPARTRASFV